MPRAKAFGLSRVAWRRAIRNKMTASATAVDLGTTLQRCERAIRTWARRSSDSMLPASVERSLYARRSREARSAIIVLSERLRWPRLGRRDPASRQEIRCARFQAQADRPV